jgi:hypothetical protein
MPKMPEVTTLCASSTGAAGVADTLTITPPAGGKIAITDLQIYRATNAAEATGAVATITTTNLPGTPTWTLGLAVPAGNTVKDVDMHFNPPWVSSAATTAVTFVCSDPGTTPQWNSRCWYHVLQVV